MGASLNSSARVGNNLRNLAEVASQFHSAASSTASTIRNGSTASPPRTYSRAPTSLNGVFPEYKRERVETYICEAQRQTFPVERVTSPQPVSVTPPRQASPACLPRLAIPPFGNTVLDAEEEDELEFERMYLEGLEDLAKDSIRTGDFDQAVVFLNKAIGNSRPSGVHGEDSGRLNVQLAICYLFQGDWRRAEPIVLDLAKSPATADMVTFTMLHAISLAYLKSYSFDRALELCKQAVSGKRRHLKLKGLPFQDDSDYAESLGLLATILEMSGDYISAEIYRRRMRTGYVYKHPADRFEFITSHRGLLQSVLGADLPDLPQAHSPSDVDSDGLFELDANIPSYQSQREGASWEANNAYMSSLRAKRYEWQRSEFDTGKEVVVHDIDSAICMEEGGSSKSTSPVSPVSPLKRRLSRMFGSRRAGRQREPPSPVYEDKAKEASPITRWFKDRRNVFGMKKSRSLKRAHDKALMTHFEDPHNNKTFRLLRMQRMSLEDMRDSAYGSETSGHADSNAGSGGSMKLVATSPVEFGTGREEPSSGMTGAGICRSDSIQETPVDVSSDYALHRSYPPDDYTATPAELPADSCTPSSTPEQRRQVDIDCAVAFAHMYSLFPPSSTSKDEGHMSFLAIPDRTSHSITPEQVLVATAPDPFCDAPQRAQDPPASESSTSGAHPQYSDGPKQPVAPEATSPDVTALLGSLATILALLPSFESSASRRVARMKLKSIASRLAPVTSDMQIVYDVQQVVASLGDHESVTVERKRSPSPTRVEDAAMSPPDNITGQLRTQSAPSGISYAPDAPSPNAKEDVPALRRSFSWVAEPKVLCSPQCRSDSGGGGPEWPFLGCSCREHEEHGGEVPSGTAKYVVPRAQSGYCEWWDT